MERMRQFRAGRKPVREASLKELFARADAVDATADPRVKQLLQAFRVRINPRLVEVFDRLIKEFEARKLLSRLPRTRSPVGSEVAGLFEIGRTSPWDAPFGFGAHELAGGILIAGQQQRGKTTLLIILMALLAGRVPIFAIDCKRKLRKIKSVFPRARVIHVRDWRGNLHQKPPNVPMGVWLDVISEVFTESYGLFDLSQGLYLDMFGQLHEMYRRHAGPDILPTYLDVVDYLDDAHRKLYGPLAQAKERIQGRIRALRPTLSSILATAKGYVLDPFIRDRDLVIFEVDGLRIQNQKLFGKYLLAYLYYYLLNNPLPGLGGALRLLVVMDEATRYLTKERGREGQSFQSDVFTRNWEAGMGIVSVVHQTKDKLDDCVRASGAAKIICGGLADGNDIWDLGRSMNLGREWHALVPELGVRELIVRDIRFPEPFAVQVRDIREMPELEGLRDLTDAEVAGDPQALAAEQDVSPRVPYYTVKSALGEERPLTDAERRLLMEIHNHPLRPIGVNYSVIGSQSHGSKTATRLGVMGYIIVREFSRCRGGNVKIAALTDKGRRKLEVAAARDGGKGRGGTLHRQFAVLVKKIFTADGYACRVEEEVSGKRTDVVARKGDEAVAVEIVISDDLERERRNLEEDLKRFDRVIFATRTATQRTNVNRLARSVEEKRVTVMLLTDLMTDG